MGSLKDRIKARRGIALLVGKIVSSTSKWNYSPFLPLKWAGKIFTAPVFYLLRDDYYKLLIFANRNRASNSAVTKSSKINPDEFFIRAITGDKRVTEKSYLLFLSDKHFCPEMQFEWARRFMEIGRLDLARIGFINLVERKKDKPQHEKCLEIYRILGAVCFMLGRNEEANHYWGMAGRIRRSMFNPQTPKNYRILGSAWFAAIGHIAMLDYYLKFIKMHTKEKVRIVAQWNVNQELGRDLLYKFSKLGITFLETGELETDYNEWAAANDSPTWSQLSNIEKAALVDDFWEYDFSDGEILGYAHAAARIQKEWSATGNSPLFALSNIEKNWVKSFLVNLGVPADAWFVCLHVRESGFHKEWNSCYPSMRDADISDYTQAIEKIVNAGGWVLRMGDSSMKVLPEMKHVIDYAHSPFKTPMADILLAASCRFFLGTNSGFATISAIYGVPCALSNWVPLGWPLWPHQDLMMPKLFREKQSQRYLKLEEIFSRGLAYIQNWSDLPNNIELVPNTPEDLEQLASVMLSSSTNKGASREFHENYMKIAKQYGGFTGSQIARFFVEKHADIFSVSESDLTETTRGNILSWHEQSKDNMTVILN